MLTLTLTKPDTVPQDIWDTLSIKHKAWIIEHEKMHKQMLALYRDKVADIAALLSETA